MLHTAALVLDPIILDRYQRSEDLKKPLICVSQTFLPTHSVGIGIMNTEQFRKAGYQAIDRICDYYGRLEKLPVHAMVEPGYLNKYLPPTAPEHGEDFQEIADDYQKLIVPGLMHWQHPSFFAYFPAGCTYEGILADLYSTSTANPGFNWNSSPACTELEAHVMDWACQLFGLSNVFMNASKIGAGVMQNGASDSALIATVAARYLFQSQNAAVPLDKLVIYTTTQTHSLGIKAGAVLGLPVRILEVKAEHNYSLHGETLRLALEEDDALGRKPFILIATGTTSSGAMDNLSEIQQIAPSSLWIHVDAAWAGVALSCPEYREECHLRAINERANSFCTNFHKWGLVNLDASALWVRNRDHLTEAMDITPPYLRTKYGTDDTVDDYRNRQLGLSRRFRSLKLWFVLRSFGIEGFREHIRKGISLSHIFTDFIKQSYNLALVARPSLAMSVFRLYPKPEPGQPEYSLGALNSLNKLLYENLMAHHDILLTQTELNGVFCIRMVVGATRTSPVHVHRACELIQEEANLALATWMHATGETEAI